MTTTHHPKVQRGRCPVCGHYGDDCTGGPTLHELADQAYAAFEVRTRRDGEDYVTLKADTPEWVLGIVRKAHDDGQRLPDDWRYKTVHEAFCSISDATRMQDADFDDLEAEFADGADVHHADLLAWGSSNSSRLRYCDDALADCGHSLENTAQLLQLGQGQERREVFAAVLDGLRERLETDAAS
ncbi:MAG: hypothetical protein QOJ97_248 [Solirubrobacteraceae bacterium]|jgi:hypothetical protein|nr:hypothetical protein [Solirubrobacteraceae bacterium]